MRNQQVLIDSLPQGKLSAGNYRLAETEIAAPKAGEVLVKTTAFAITAGTRGRFTGQCQLRRCTHHRCGHEQHWCRRGGRQYR